MLENHEILSHQIEDIKVTKQAQDAEAKQVLMHEVMTEEELAEDIRYRKD